MSIKIVSNAFKDGEMIPSKYTCKGENISPQISWQVQSDDKKIKSIALIMNDPDAPNGDWVHWVVFEAFFSHFEAVFGLCDWFQHLWNPEYHWLYALPCCLIIAQTISHIKHWFFP